jgi:hypothetical protein
MAENLIDTTKKEITDLGKEQLKKIEELMILYVDPENQKGIQRDPSTLNRKLGLARRYISTSYGKPTPNAQIVIDKAVKSSDDVHSQVEDYFNGEWTKYRERVEAVQFDLFNLK